MHIPDDFAATVGLALNMALQELPEPDESAELNIQLLARPPFYKRMLERHASAAAYQTEDGIGIYPESDPLKLAFRLGHETSHWLLSKHTKGQRPPLWLDEGLAQLIGRRTAEAKARSLHMTIAPPAPACRPADFFSLEQLAALSDYPASKAGTAAFYWQAEAAVDYLYKRLGRTIFLEYLMELAAPDAPAWDVPLRTRYYWNDGDFNRLTAHIRFPDAPTTE